MNVFVAIDTVLVALIVIGIIVSACCTVWSIVDNKRADRARNARELQMKLDQEHYARFGWTSRSIR